MNKNLRRFVTTALLVGVCLLLGLTPIGFIPIPPISITLLCIPVIIGTITQGLGAGLVLGFFFGLTSFLQIFIRPTPLSQLLFSLSPFKTVILVFVPRLLVPIVIWLVHRAITGDTRLRRNTAVGLGAFAGSLANTVLFLGTLYLLFLPEIGELSTAFGTTPELLGGVVAGIGAVNGLPEAAVAVLLSMPIVAALTAVKKPKMEK